MKKKLLMSAALLTACCAVSTPVLAKEDAQPWVNKQSADEEHVIKETGTDKRFSIGKTVSVKLDSAYVTKDAALSLHGDLQCMQVVRGTENTVTATYTGVLLAE